MQFQCDLLNVGVVRPRVSETTALGAAYLAGLATGVWKNKDEIASHWDAERRFEPRLSDDKRRQLVAGWTKAVGRAKSWANE